MEISSSAVTGAMRVGLQIASSHKRPVLEIYHQLRNRCGPKIELDGNEAHRRKTRLQEIFVQFILVNIGGERAENIKLSFSGKLSRNSPREGFGDLLDVVIPQMAPG